MKCIDCIGFYYKGGEYGYCKATGMVIEFDHEEKECKHTGNIYYNNCI